VSENATPLGRIGEPVDQAGITVYLAAPAGRWTTGESVVVDGGWTSSGG
jgi:NAD(P)-dependent dehydrogenase (short-subunit alcohol dehydrogenase family)